MRRGSKAAHAADMETALRKANPGYYEELDRKAALAQAAQDQAAAPEAPANAAALPAQTPQAQEAIISAAALKELLENPEKIAALIGAPYRLLPAPYAFEPSHFELRDTTGYPVCYMNVPLKVTAEVKERLAVTRAVSALVPVLYVAAAQAAYTGNVEHLSEVLAQISIAHRQAAADRKEAEERQAAAEQKYVMPWEEGGTPALPLSSKKGSESGGEGTKGKYGA